jgi:hypothetical protein
MIIGRTTPGATAKDLVATNGKAVAKLSFAQEGFIKSVSFYCSSGSTLPELFPVFYQVDVGGGPGALLATGTYRLGTATGWNTIQLDSWVHVSAGDLYVGLISSRNIPSAVQSGSGTTYRNSDTYADGPTTVFGTATAEAEELPVNVDFSPGAAVTPGDISVTRAFSETLMTIPSEVRVSRLYVEVLRSVTGTPAPSTARRRRFCIIT